MRNIALSIIIGIFLISSVTSYEFDNLKTYDDTTKTVTITNSFLKLFDLDEVATIKLVSDLNVLVIAGEDRKVAEIEINNFADGYEDALKKIRFSITKDEMKFYEEFDKRLSQIQTEEHSYVG